jgi:rhodanese-related sulfurtransferase
MNETPEISVHELAEKLASDTQIKILDVRELWEIGLVNLKDARVVELPLSQLARELAEGLPADIQDNRDAEIVVMCHSGIRSADVTRWMVMQGWRNVRSLHGGIDAYAVEIDKSLGRY